MFVGHIERSGEEIWFIFAGSFTELRLSYVYGDGGLSEVCNIITPPTKKS